MSYVPPGFRLDPDTDRGGVELRARNRFTRSPLKLRVRRPQSRTDARGPGGWAYSLLEPRVRAMKIRTIKSRHSCAIPRRFSKITCGRVSKRPPRDGRRETSYLVSEIVDSVEKLALLVFQPPGLLLELYDRFLV